MAHASAHLGKDELDRKWEGQLQELRVMQTGAQLTAAFLLTLPFQPVFGDLTTAQTWLYLSLVIAAALTVAVVITPVAVHRRLSGDDVKERVVNTGHKCLQVALLLLALLIAGMVALIIDVVVGTPAGWIAGAVALAVEALLLIVLPNVLRSSEG